MDPFRDPFMREALKQAREMRDLLDNPGIRDALKIQRQYGRLSDHWNRTSSSEFRILRDSQADHKYFTSLVSSPAFNATRDFLIHNDVARHIMRSQEWGAAFEAQRRQHDLFSVANLTMVRAISEVTEFFNNNIHHGLYPHSFAADILSTISIIEEPTDEQSLQEFIEGLENLLTLIINKCKELASDPTTYRAMAHLAFTIFVFLYPLYDNHQTEKRVIESVNQTRIEILREVEKLKPAEVKDVYYVVEREAKLKSNTHPKSPALRILSANQTLKLVKSKGKWIYVEYFDYLEGVPKTGWVLKKYTKRIKSLEARRNSVLTKELSSVISDTALLSEQSLAEDWNRPEEDAAWSHLQQVP